MRKTLCLISIIFIICSSNYIVFAEENDVNNNETTNNTITDVLQNQRKELQNQINEATGQLDEVQEDLSENLQQVQKLDEKIENSENEIKSLEQEISKLKKSINEVEKNLNAINQKYNKQKKIFEQRMVAISETSNTQYLDVLLKSRSLTDFLSTYYVISVITEYDNDLLNSLGEKKQTIDNSKEKLEREKQELASSMEKQTRTSKILQNTKAVRENFVTKLSEQEKDIQNKIDEYNAQFALINNQILELAQGSIDTEYVGGEFAWPIPGYTTVTSKYGMRVHPITGVYKLHTGVDVGAPMGANFVAANDGIVIKAGYNGAYGNMVIIDHGGGISTLYAHGSQILVEVGQAVKREDPILKVGSTGYSTGAHAHFEVRINGVVTNPMPYITNGLIPHSNNNDS